MARFALFGVIIVAAIAALLLGNAIPAEQQKVDFKAAGITSSGKGVLVPFTLAIRPGSGKILVDINGAVYDNSAETSLLKARKAAEKIIGASLGSYDIEISLVKKQEEVGGESAGLVFTAAIVAAFEGKSFRPDVAASAALDENGKLFPIEGVVEKIHAAAADGKKFFVVAKDQQIKEEGQLPITVIRAETPAEAVGYLLD